MKSILLIQLRRIGDVLMTTPSIRAIAQAFPDAHIDFLTEAPSNQVLEHNPYLRQVHLYPKQPTLRAQFECWKVLKAQQYDLVIDFFGNARSALMAWGTRAPQRIGFDFKGRSWCYTHKVPRIPSEKYAAFHKEALLQVLDVQLQSPQLDFLVGSEDHQYAADLLASMDVQADDQVVSLSPVSRQPYKVWPARKFSAIADHLIQTHGMKVLFIYGPGEEKFVEEVRTHMKEEALPNYEPPTLGQTRALFEKMVLHVGNDNGPAHFAIAAHIPTVIVFGKPKAVNWTPPEQALHQAVEYDPGCKNACTYPQCAHLNCIQQVSLEAVQAKVDEVLKLHPLKKKD